MSNQTPPQPPEGCVYGPWFNPTALIESTKWLCYKKISDGTVALCRYASVGADREWRWIAWSFEDNPGIAELLRVAAERDELRAEVEKKDRFIERWKVEVDDLQAEIERLKERVGELEYDLKGTGLQ